MLSKEVRGLNNGKSSKDTFRWAVGIESSCIPHLQIDQFQWTQHDRFWREDFRRAAEELKCRWLRYAVAWHLIETRPGHFDWRWADERFELARELGLELMVDLAHFGTPTWLPDAFGDVDFPGALERFSRAFGKRYRGVVHSVCPINEPLITALFCGDIGLWPPHGRCKASYMTVLSRVGQGLIRSIAALREVSPQIEIVICDALEFACAEAECERSAPPEVVRMIQDDVTLRMHRRHIVLDLITGRVDQEHPLRGWLEAHGFGAMDLNWFLRNAVEIDLIGLDYYPHCEAEIYAGENRQLRQRTRDTPAGLHALTRDYWNRHRVPMMIAETSTQGDDQRRREWLEFTVADVRRLRSEGIPVVGYTWWPLVDHLDWDGALLHHIGRIHHVGLYELQRQADGEMRRAPTPLVSAYRKLADASEAAVGKLAAEPAVGAHGESIRKATRLIRRKLEYPIIVHCHLRWDGVWQRPQQFLSRLSRNHRVLFAPGPTLVETEEAPRFEWQVAPDFPNVTIFETFLPAARFGDGEWVDGQRHRLLKEALEGPLAGQFENAVQWFYDPMAVRAFAGKLGEAGIVYDCMDELSKFRFARPEIAQREKELLAQADVVFCGGRRLYESKRQHNDNCHFHGCGVDVEHFARAARPETVVPSDLHFVSRPILGYFGVVDERIDYELLGRLADANPDWNIVMIGPLAKVSANELPSRGNLFWVGRRAYSDLPAYARAFDVCLMPFALNESTEFINPTKALEYMATGRPVVSSALSDVVANFGSVVKIARDHDEFIRHCREAVASPDGQAIERGLNLARASGWDAVVARLEGHIREALCRKGMGAGQPRRGVLVRSEG